MTPEARRPLMLAAVVALLPALGCRGTRAPPTHAPARPPEGCLEVVTSENAREIFRRLAALRGADRCVMAGLATQRSVMRIRWTRDGAALPDTVVTPAACAGPAMRPAGRYALQVDASFATACPATSVALQRTLSQDAPAPARAGERPRPGRTKTVLALLGALGALALLGALVWRRRGSQLRVRGPGEG